MWASSTNSSSPSSMSNPRTGLPVYISFETMYTPHLISPLLRQIELIELAVTEGGTNEVRNLAELSKKKISKSFVNVVRYVPLALDEFAVIEQIFKVKV